MGRLLSCFQVTVSGSCTGSVEESRGHSEATRSNENSSLARESRQGMQTDACWTLDLGFLLRGKPSLGPGPVLAAVSSYVRTSVIPRQAKLQQVYLPHGGHVLCGAPFYLVHSRTLQNPVWLPPTHSDSRCSVISMFDSVPQ